MLKQAPAAFIGLSVVALAAGFAGGMLYYSGQIGSLKEQMNTKDGQIGRYRVALGVDKASRGAMVDLTDDELRAMATTIVSKVRDLCSPIRRRAVEIRSATKVDDRAAKRREYQLLRALATEGAEQYNKTIRSDRNLLNNEILRRIDKKAAAAIVRVPIWDAETGTPTSILTFPATGDGLMDYALMCAAADETEQLSKLLPTRKR